MNLVLIGYRGTGKSTVAHLAAKALDLHLISMDAELENRFGRTIGEFVASEGWDAFREAESLLAAELAGKSDQLIDCGGGVIVRPENMIHLKKTGRVAWLKATVDTIQQRICGNDTRPALTAGGSFLDEISDVLAERTPLYQAAADLTVPTDNVTPDEIANQIVDWWKAGNSQT